MKLKVLVIALSLKNNKIAKSGEIIDSKQLPNESMVKTLIADGYVSKVKKGSDKLKDDSKEDNEFSFLSDYTVKELKEFAEKNSITLEGERKQEIFDEILLTLKNK